MDVTWGKADAVRAEAPRPVVSHEDTPRHPIKKMDEDQQLVFGEVYVPNFPDSQGDFMTAASIRDMAYGFMRKGDMYALDTGHDRSKNASYIVESFIARDDDTCFIPGSWVLGVKVADPDVWAMVKSGDINGFSVDGHAMQEDAILEIDLPEVIQGRTSVVKGEAHDFFVRFDADGKFLGGYTSPGADGHSHQILRGTITEEAAGHAHMFSFVEGVIDVRVAS